MTDRPRSELVLRAHAVLGLSAAGQSPADDDLKIIDDLWEPLIDRLDGEGVTTTDGVSSISDPDIVPGAQFLDLAVLLADAARGEFGLAALPGNLDPQLSERRLRVINSTGPTLETVETTDADTGETVEYDQPQTVGMEYF